jgi:DNA-binding transcriptional MerR regulator
VKERYISLTQVCTKLAVKPHVLRYWEKEFEMTPKRNSAGRRIYSSAQVERLGLIKHLVYEERLTVKGAKRRLGRLESGQPSASDSRDNKLDLAWLRQELAAVRQALAEGVPGR